MLHNYIAALQRRFTRMLANPPIADPVARRQAALLQIMLAALALLALVRLPLFLAVDIRNTGLITAIAANSIAVLVPLTAVVLLRRGAFTPAVLMTATGMLLSTAAALLATGLRQSGMLPVVLVLPLVFTGLLIDWRGLLGVGAASVAVVMGIAVLERQGSPLTAFAPAAELPLNMAALFTFVVLLLCLLLSRFRHGYRQELMARNQAEARAHAAAQRLQVLADVSRAVSEAGVAYQSVLDHVVHSVAAQLGGVCGIRLRSADGQRLELVAQHDVHPPARLADHADAAWPAVAVADQTPSAQVFRTGQPVLLSVADPERLYPAVDPALSAAVRQHGLHSLIHVPLRLHGATIGVLSVARQGAEQPAFAPDDLTLAQELADRVALAIGNAQLYAALERANADLEQRVQARTAELRQRTDLIELASDAIIIRDFATDTVTYWNQGAERLYGWSSAEMHGRQIHTILGTIFPQSLAEIKAALLQADVWEGELVQYHRDGQPINVASRWTLERDRDGQPRTLLAINTDISERKRMEAQLHQYAARAAALAEIGHALAEIDLDDPALFDTLARRVAELVGATCTVTLRSADSRHLETKGVFHPDPDALALLRLLAATPYSIGEGLAGQVAQTGVALFLNDLAATPARVQAHPTYQRYLERYGMAHVLLVPLRVQGRTLGTLGVSRGTGATPYTDDDQRFLQQIADRAALAIEHVRTYAETQQARAEAEQASQAKSVFLSGLSHELRTPLNAILGFTGTLLMQLPGPLTALQGKQLRIVQDNATRLLVLLTDLLDLAKIESGKVELIQAPIVCQDVIAEVAARLRAQAERKGLALTVAAPAEPVVVQSDARVLAQILTHLVDNAIKFTDAGTVRIELASVYVEAQTRTRIRVVDTGIGIAPEDQAQLFREFGRIDSAAVRARPGTGLGLRLANQLAALLGGHITVESDLGQGSTFTLAFWEG